MTDAELGYAAGLVDGEGSLGINRHSNGKGDFDYQVYVTVVNTKPELLKFLKDRWGGSIQNHPTSGFGKRACQHWRIASQLADTFLTDIYPHLLSKKEQAKHLRNFQELVRQGKRARRPYPKSYKEMQERIHEKVKLLNSK